MPLTGAASLPSAYRETTRLVREHRKNRCHTRGVNARLATLVSVPLVVAGSLAAHLTAGRLLSPSDGGPAEQAIGVHGYLAHGPLAIAALRSRACVAVAFHTWRRPEDAPPHLSPRAFAVLPMAIFVVQEYTERAVHHDFAPADALATKGFLVGLTLQVPFAAVMYLIAR